VKTLLLAIAATGAIGLGMTVSARAEAAQVHIAVNLGVPVVTPYRAQPRAYYHPYRPAYWFVPPHRYYYGHHHERLYINDVRWQHGPIHGGQVYGRTPVIKRIDINPRLQQR
jgi:hypothetical protein